MTIAALLTIWLLSGLFVARCMAVGTDVHQPTTEDEPSMTAREAASLRRLKAENDALREQISTHVAVYRALLVEVAELHATVDLVRQALEERP